MYNREERSETFVIAPFLIGFFGFVFFQSCAAILAVEGFEVVTVTVATGTASLLQLLMFAHHRSRDNARRDGYDGVADEHNDGREEAAHGGNGRDVAIADGRHGDDGPVDAVGDVVELRVGGIAFDGIHHRAHGCDEDEHEKEEDENLRCTDP